jgi:hypothetical protein
MGFIATDDETCAGKWKALQNEQMQYDGALQKQPAAAYYDNRRCQLVI